MAEEKKEDVLACPCCGKPLTEDETFWHCECGFIAYRNKSGTEITAEELRKIFAGQGSELTFTSRTGKPFKGKLKLSDDKKKVVFDIQSKDTGLNCPKCGKPILEYDKNFSCEGGDFRCWKDIDGTEISRDELQRVLEGQSDELGFRSRKSGKTFLARLVLNEAKDGLEFKFADRKSEDTGLKCPKCGKKIVDDGRAYKCEDGDFRCWKNTRGHEITVEELQKVFAGQGDELEFTSRSSGKLYKGRLMLNAAKDGLDFEFVDNRKNNKEGNTK